ncbi:MAG TPA: dihydroorotate dehydrogenase-like protein [Chromatiales bacterium]|nr:dihydroorotate dehydrogenase-like protein [Chromatiales bacterium]
MDLKTNYLGLELKNPIVHSASPISESLDAMRQLEDAGASAVVMYSLFEEQITMESQSLDHFLSYGSESFGEALSYFPEADDYKVGPQEYLKRVAAAKMSLDIPVIGSLNGVSTGGWVEFAKLIEEAGADALELNIYFVPTNPEMTGLDITTMHEEIVRDVAGCIDIPLSVKIAPFFSAIPNVCKRLADAGADGLVLFNRFYQPDIDLETLEVVPHLVLSNSNDLRLPLRWVSILYGRVDCDFAITSGVHTHQDVLKGLMAGAKVTCMTSAILKNGPYRIANVLHDLVQWMEEHEYESVKQMQGSMSQKNVKEPTAFERANYMKMLHSWKPDPTGKLY